ncbi:MAG: hypothetical protein LUG61_00285 [Lachnospiraceae bacterium]|nr:hypothetical protein [Lachnospiraceae bacterium]
MAVYEAGHILNVCSLAEALPHGHRISTAILTYDCVLDSEALVPEQFCVENRHIVRAYTNSEAMKSPTCCNGRHVILELDLTDPDAPLLLTETETGRAVTAGMETMPVEAPALNGSKGQDGLQKGKPGHGPRSWVVMSENRVVVKQVRPLKKADGTEIPCMDEWVASREALTEGVDAFQVFQYEDIPCNLFVPKRMEAGKTYPLVLFVPDASVKGNDRLIVLTQGNGAMSFAADVFQKKHPCFVLAPQIPEHYAARSDQGIAGLGTLHEKVKEILNKVCRSYPVDRSRIYNTGQSMGCILGFGMNICYPDLFAASLLVGGQWGDLPSTARLAGKKMWMLNSDGDARAYPGMNEIAGELEKAGDNVHHFTLDARWPLEKQEQACREAMASGASILYGTFEDQSVVPEGVVKSPVANHMNTWPAAYQLETVKDWLFEQSLSEEDIFL